MTGEGKEEKENYANLFVYGMKTKKKHLCQLGRYHSVVTDGRNKTWSENPDVKIAGFG